jgi:hypothetical protein
MNVDEAIAVTQAVKCVMFFSAAGFQHAEPCEPAVDTNGRVVWEFDLVEPGAAV